MIGDPEQGASADSVRWTEVVESIETDEFLELALLAGGVSKAPIALVRWSMRITARTVTINVRYSDFSTVTRSQSTREPTADVENIVARALKLLEKTEAGHRPIRLLSVNLHNFGRDEAAEQAAEKSNGRLPF